MVRAVQFIVKNHRFLKRIIAIKYLERLLVRTVSQKGVQTTLSAHYYDFVVDAIVILDHYDLSLTLKQILALTNINCLQIFNVLLYFFRFLLVGIFFLMVEGRVED